MRKVTNKWSFVEAGLAGASRIKLGTADCAIGTKGPPRKA